MREFGGSYDIRQGVVNLASLLDRKRIACFEMVHRALLGCCEYSNELSDPI
jgi:hypothetical protein